MEKLKELVKHCYIKTLEGKKSLIFAEIVSEYKNIYNIPHYAFQYMQKMNKNVGMIIANFYESIPHQPNNIFIKASYNQLTKEVLNQFEFIRNSSARIEFEPFEGEGEPYENSYEMLNDIHNNFHMYFFKTECGFGKEKDSMKNNQMLSKTNIFIGDYELLINDVFRITHDIFGHATYGYGFGPIGEDLAWITHSQMFTPLARAAITTETRGQNCWVNYGPHMQKNDTEIFTNNDINWLPPCARPFAKQKTILLPEEVSGVRLTEENGIIKATTLKNWNPFLNLLYV